MTVGGKNGRLDFRRSVGLNADVGCAQLAFCIHLCINLNPLDVHLREVDQVDIPVQAAIQVEVRHVRRNQFRVSCIGTAYGNGDASSEPALADRILPELVHGFGDVGRPFVVAAYMLRHLAGIDIDLRGLSGSFKLQ